MTKIAFCILCHEAPELLVPLVDFLSKHEDVVVIHYDRKASKQSYQFLRKVFSQSKDVLFAERAAVQWGSFGMIQATLNCMRVVRQQLHVDYVYLLSGSDLPIKPLRDLRVFLDRQSPADFIESLPITTRWVTDGNQEERFRYFHYVNWRRNPRLYDFNIKLQTELGIRRRPPEGLELHIGSQWWCLHRETCCKILDLVDKRPEITRYFRRCWIPDESFFQTLVRAVSTGRAPQPKLTLTQFDSTGRQIWFHNDHERYLRNQPAALFFARKVSPRAHALRRSFLSDDSRPIDAQNTASAVGISAFQAVSEWGRWGNRLTRRAFYISADDAATLERLRSDFIIFVGSWRHSVALALGSIGISEESFRAGFLLEGAPIDYGDLPANKFLASYSPEMRDYMPLEFLCNVSDFFPESKIVMGLCQKEGRLRNALISSPRCNFVFARLSLSPTVVASYWPISPSNGDDKTLVGSMVSHLAFDQSRDEVTLAGQLRERGKALTIVEVPSPNSVPTFREREVAATSKPRVMQ